MEACPRPLGERPARSNAAQIRNRQGRQGARSGCPDDATHALEKQRHVEVDQQSQSLVAGLQPMLTNGLASIIDALASWRTWRFISGVIGMLVEKLLSEWHWN